MAGSGARGIGRRGARGALRLSLRTERCVEEGDECRHGEKPSPCSRVRILDAEPPEARSVGPAAQQIAVVPGGRPSPDVGMSGLLLSVAPQGGMLPLMDLLQGSRQS